MSPAIRALERLDQWTVERYQEIQKQEKPEEYVPSPTDALYLYGRSFFLKDRPVEGRRRDGGGVLPRPGAQALARRPAIGSRRGIWRWR